MAGAAFPGCRVLAAEPLSGGRRNINLKLRLDRVPEPIVLRLYRHDPALCRKEQDLQRLVSGSVPVPEVLYAEPPFALLRFVEGASFRDLAPEDIPRAAASAGEVLAAIGRFTFEASGWLGPGPAVGAPLLEGPDPEPRFIDQCLASPNARKRVPPELARRTSAFVWKSASEFDALNRARPRLVHGDFNPPNLLVRGHTIAAVIDWEFAVAGSPIADIGNFLRFQPAAEPYFSDAYLGAGGTLPPDWRRMARLADLVALCEFLSRDELPDGFAAQVLCLVRTTVDQL